FLLWKRKRVVCLHPQNGISFESSLREFGFFEDVFGEFLVDKNFLKKKFKKVLRGIKKRFIFAPALRNKPSS
ncbi:hypothetical protein, partial [uncultured Aquimarina sp.]|uniref:hypothetical protein n=1 Tax=uncultured Aquimarina sp. TaxID=575652 RepID=UPI0026073C72